VQFRANAGHGAILVTHSALTPIEALITGLAIAARLARAITSRGRASRGSKPATMRSNHVLSSASSVFAAVAERQKGIVAPAERFARKAPAATPGQMLGPSRRIAAREMPAGSHNGATTPAKAKVRLILAATMNASATARILAVC